MMERLQKILAHAGVASRRKCEELIVTGRVRVNGAVVTELGTKADAARDRIEVDGVPIRLETKTYVILHKPRGYLSDLDEERGKPLAIDLVPTRERLFVAGRLDANSEGLLLLTNDGALAHRLTHPRYAHEKEYLVLVAGEPDDATLARLQKGVWYAGEKLRADSRRARGAPTAFWASRSRTDVAQDHFARRQKATHPPSLRGGRTSGFAPDSCAHRSHRIGQFTGRQVARADSPRSTHACTIHILDNRSTINL